MMSIIGTIVVGLVVGLIARAIKPGDDTMGWLMTIVLGIAGSFLASWAGYAMGLYPQGSGAGWIASIIGAVVVLFLYNMIRGKTSH